jgi:hypothetical protein
MASERVALLEAAQTRETARRSDPSNMTDEEIDQRLRELTEKRE